MTAAELNAVRNFRERIRLNEWEMSALRKAAEDLVPVRDGMPHEQSAHSKVESLSLKICELSAETARLRLAMDAAAYRLSNELKEILHGQELQVMTLRYVSCRNFRDIEFELKLSDSRVFYLHRHALKKLKSDNSQTTVDVQSDNS